MTGMLVVNCGEILYCKALGDDWYVSCYLWRNTVLQKL